MSVSLAYLTREPAVNRRYQITTNRLCDPAADNWAYLSKLRSKFRL